MSLTANYTISCILQDQEKRRNLSYAYAYCTVSTYTMKKKNVVKITSVKIRASLMLRQWIFFTFGIYY